MLKAGLLATMVLVGAASEAMAQQQLQYRYDSHGRLVRVARPTSGGMGNVTTYTYDAADNRRERAISVGSVASLRLLPIEEPPVEYAEGASPTPASADVVIALQPSHPGRQSVPGEMDTLLPN